MKNSAKVTLLDFNTVAGFLHDVHLMVSKNDVLEAGKCSCCACVGNVELRL